MTSQPRHKSSIRPTSWTTLATYAALSFAGGISFFTPERITDQRPSVPEAVGLKVGDSGLPGALAKEETTAADPASVSLTHEMVLPAFRLPTAPSGS